MLFVYNRSVPGVFSTNAQYTSGTEYTQLVRRLRNRSTLVNTTETVSCVLGMLCSVFIINTTGKSPTSSEMMKVQ